MELPKLFVAIGIAIFLVLFLSSCLSTFYKLPETDTSSCYSSNNADCYSAASQKCGTEDTDCYNRIYSSQEYKDCTENNNKKSENCMLNAYSGITNYQIIFFVIMAFLAIFSIVLGFLMIEKSSIGTGFIGGGILMLLSANMLSMFSIFTGSLSSIFSSLSSYSSSQSPLQNNILPYLQIMFYFVALLVLILFAYFRLEKPREES